MRNKFYNSIYLVKDKRKNPFFATSILVLLIFLMINTTGNAQELINWTGATSTDVYDSTNWEDALSTPATINNNTLQVDSAYKFTNLPVMGPGNGNDTVNQINISIESIFTVDKGDDSLHMTNGSYNTWHGTMQINSGYVDVGNNRIELRDSACLLILKNDAVLEVNGGGNAYFMMSKADVIDVGGSMMVLDSAKVYSRRQPIRRFSVDYDFSIITISNKAEIHSKGNSYDDFVWRVEYTKQIRGAAGWEPVITYDGGSDYTIITARSDTTFEIRPLAEQSVFENENGDTLSVWSNQGLANKSALQWKYSTTQGGPYDQVIAGADSAVYVPNFATAGIYYVVCEGTRSDNGTIEYSNEVKVAVAVKKVIVSPEEYLYIWEGEPTGVYTVEELGTVTSRKWKYTQTPGSGYVDFADTLLVSATDTDTAFQGKLPGTSGDIFYIICESTVDGILYQSKEMPVEIINAPKDLTWTGEYDTIANNPFNWSPCANPLKNKMWIDGTDPLYQQEGVLDIRGIGNITIEDLGVFNNGKFTVLMNETDSMFRPAAVNLSTSGHLTFKGGYFYFNRQWYMDKATGSLTLDGTFLKGGPNHFFLLGHKSEPRGIQFFMKGNAIADVIPARIPSSDTTSITMSDNAKIICRYNWAADANQPLDDFLVNGKIVPSDDNSLYYDYDADADITYLYSIPADEAQIASDSKVTYLQMGTVGSDITSTGTDGKALEWKYSTNPATDFVSFDTPQTGTVCNPIFSTSGKYFVGLFADNVERSNLVIVESVYFHVTDNIGGEIDKMTLDVEEEGTELMVTEPNGLLEVVWMYGTTSGTYDINFIPDPIKSINMIPLFYEDGVYYLACIGTFGDDLIQIPSNEVKMIIGDTSSVNVNNVTQSEVNIFPNPTNGKFFVELNVNNFSLEVVNLQGKVIMKNDYVNITGPQEIEIEEKGVYFLKINTGSEIRINRIIVE